MKYPGTLSKYIHPYNPPRDQSFKLLIHKFDLFSHSTMTF